MISIMTFQSVILVIRYHPIDVPVSIELRYLLYIFESIGNLAKLGFAPSSLGLQVPRQPIESFQIQSDFCTVVRCLVELSSVKAMQF